MQESRCIASSLITIRKMSGGDSQSTITNKIARSAVNLQVCLRIVGNTAVVLLVLRVAEENDAFDLCANSSREPRNGTSDESCALTVTVR